jgi:hypothetical protein
VTVGTGNDGAALIYLSFSARLVYLGGMVRKAFSFVVASAVAAVLFGAPTLSYAQDKKVEAAAKALQKKAMGDDYLATDFVKAREKLDKAIAQCGTDKCSANTRALLRRDLGTVLIVGAIDKAAGQTAFNEAAKLDATVALDPDYKTKDTEAAWEKAKKASGSAGGDKPAGGGDKPAGGGDKPAAGGANPEGDFAHNAIAEQVVRTPIPIYVEYSGTEAMAKVIARYKGIGMSEWRVLELKKMGENGYGGLVPCLDVQSGKFQYFIQGLNAEKESIAEAGDRKNPYIVQVRSEITSESPHLPGQEPPKQCADTGDCPPDFPGCKNTGGGVSATELLKDGNVDCEADTECKSKVCKAGKCTIPEGAKDPNAWPRFWVGGAVGLDLTFVPTSTNVCNLITGADPSDGRPPATPKNDNNYYCIAPDGKDYPQGDRDAQGRVTGEVENQSIPVDQERSNRIDSGITPGQLRFMVSFDYAATKNFLVGARVGFSVLNYPGVSAGLDGNRYGLAPLHLEARGTLVIGKDALAKAGFAPYVMLAGGLASYEASVAVQVKRVDPSTKSPIEPKNVQAWKVGGPGFFSVGAGGRYAINPKFALMGGLRANFAIGAGFTPSIAPEIAAQVGF